MAAAVCGLLAAPAMADELSLTGVVRDFKRGDQTGGHPDFQTATKSGRPGYGHFKGLVTMFLNDDGKPIYNASPISGKMIRRQASTTMNPRTSMIKPAFIICFGGIRPEL